MLTPVKHLVERTDRARDDSDVAYFYELLSAGEMYLKLAVAGLLSCLEDDRERHRYRLEHNLVRADGVGEWGRALDDLLAGPASQHFADETGLHHRELSQNFRLREDEWQVQLVRALDAARRAIDSDVEELPTRVAARRFFADFAALRNRTRGHGATRPASCSAAAPHLSEALKLLLDHLTLFRTPWAHLRRNLSGKYKVTELGNGDDGFSDLRSRKDIGLPDGIYLAAGGRRLVKLLSADEDVRDFYLPNGAFKSDRFEALSYATDARITLSAAEWSVPPTVLPSSETEGKGALEVVGEVFTNLPPAPRGYVARRDLEEELAEALSRQRHPIVTLVGRGGIGKTSLALEVLHRIASQDRFFSIVWFSARDIELLPDGPKLVTPRVLSTADIAREYAQLVEPEEAQQKGFKATDYFGRALSETTEDPSLFVFDNFETVTSPAELYRWLDAYVRAPNKILITTRSREFKADYPVEVGGMTEEQFYELVDATARAIGVAHLLDETYLAELYKESDGHPYIAKVLLGELALAGKPRKVERILASQDRVLEALFERTFTQLSPAGQRVFLTLSSWRSLVPVVALEAAINRPANERLDAESAIDELTRSSLLEHTVSGADETYLNVPLTAALFAQKKLPASPWRTAIEADLEVLRLFGAVQLSGVKNGVEAQVYRLFQNVAERLQSEPDDLNRYRPVLEFVARETPIGWVLLAQLLEEVRLDDSWSSDAAESYRRYLQVAPEDGQVWRALARVSRISGDFLGSVQALVTRAQLPQAPFADVSYAATRVNQYLKDGSLNFDSDEKRILLRSLVEVLESRRIEADATDLSRLAWLLMNSGRYADAKKVVREGLQLEPSNTYCRGLADRLKL